MTGAAEARSPCGASHDAFGRGCARENVENTDAVVGRRRATNISLDCAGDRVINSVRVIGGLVVRDNLTLSLIMPIHPIDAINRWKAGS
jgi:hypothetical protein